MDLWAGDTHAVEELELVDPNHTDQRPPSCNRDSETWTWQMKEGHSSGTPVSMPTNTDTLPDFDMADDDLALSDFDDLGTFGYLSPPSGDACLPILEGDDLFRSRAPSRADSTSSYNTRPRHALRDGLLAHATVI